MAKRATPKDRRKARLAEAEAKAPVKIKPLTERQGVYMKSLREKGMTFALGPAGTGKTYVPAIVAADLLTDKKIERIILTRPAVEVENEKHGFLPGDLKRKMEPWVQPVFDALRERFSRQKVDEMVKNGTVEIVPFAYMRGRTFTRAFVLLDEAQNTTPEQMKLFVTRIGGECVVAVNGDITQSDLKRTSGLALALDMARRHKLNVGTVAFTKTDVVRSGMCREWIDAFEKDEGAAPEPASPLFKAADALIEDVKRRHPGEDLRCPLMRQLEEARNEIAARPDWMKAAVRFR